MPTPTNRITYQILAAVALLTFGMAPREFAFGPQLRVRDTLRDESPSRGSTELIERGYYEQILQANRTLDQTTEISTEASNVPRFGNAFIQEERLTCLVDDIREYVSRPNLKRDVPHRIPWTTNSFGMRDLEYSKAKPERTFRIGFAGDSIGMGWGVGDDEGFEPRLEWILDDRSKRAGGLGVQVLNFAVPGHGPGQRWFHFSKVAWDFQPDLVLFESSPADLGWDERRLRPLLTRNVGFDAPVYEQTLKAAGIRPGLSSESYKDLLKPLKWVLLAGVYREAARECRSRGIPCIWILVPRVGRPMPEADREHLVRLAKEAGFDAVIDGSEAFQGIEMSTLSVGEKDYHPNAQGHERIAKNLDPLLSAVPAISRLWSKSGTDRDLTASRIDSKAQGMESQ